MAAVHPGATLTPHFRDFLPGWIARQPWYLGRGAPSWGTVGFFRFEDPDGEVGIETHLVSDGCDVYQVPMTYRGAPLGDQAAPGTGPPASHAPPGDHGLPGLAGPVDGGRWLIATAHHSVLGPRWIYDATGDPVWAAQLLDLVSMEGVTAPGGKRGAGPAVARGQRLTTGRMSRDAVIELNRVVVPGPPAHDNGLAGAVMGRWHPGPGRDAVEGCLAVVRLPGPGRDDSTPAPGTGAR